MKITFRFQTIRSLPCAITDDVKTTAKEGEVGDTQALLKAILAKLEHLDNVEAKIADIEQRLVDHQSAISSLEKSHELVLGSNGKPIPTTNGFDENSKTDDANSKKEGSCFGDDILGKYASSSSKGDFPPPLPQPQPHGSQDHGRHQQDDYGFHPRPKLEFPMFDGKEDPLPWLNHCGTFFHGQNTPEGRKVWYASLHMTGTAQLWYYRLEVNSGQPAWRSFVQLVHKRFGPPMTDSPLGELALLRRTTSVEDYCNRFLALACRDADLTENQQVQLFTAGLGHQLKIDVALHWPETLDDAIILAKAYEQRLNIGGRVSVSSAGSGSFSLSATLPRKRLTPAEMAQRKADGLCYNCDEKYVFGHICKRLFVIEVIGFDEDPQFPYSLRASCLCRRGEMSCAW